MKFMLISLITERLFATNSTQYYVYSGIAIRKRHEFESVILTIEHISALLTFSGE
jgi:hypothetical protein